MQYDSDSKRYLIRDYLFKKPGDMIRAFVNSRDAVGLAFFHFPTAEVRDNILKDFSGKNIRVLMRQKGGNI